MFFSVLLFCACLCDVYTSSLPCLTEKHWWWASFSSLCGDFIAFAIFHLIYGGKRMIEVLCRLAKIFVYLFSCNTRFLVCNFHIKIKIVLIRCIFYTHITVEAAKPCLFYYRGKNRSYIIYCWCCVLKHFSEKIRSFFSFVSAKCVQLTLTQQLRSSGLIYQTPVRHTTPLIFCAVWNLLRPCFWVWHTWRLHSSFVHVLVFRRCSFYLRRIKCICLQMCALIEVFCLSKTVIAKWTLLIFLAIF